MEAVPKHKKNTQNAGKIISVRGSVIDVWFENILPFILIPQVIAEIKPTLSALIHAYLFTSLFKVFSESLASENSSRLAATQRAEKNINELLDELSHKFHSLQQSSIDEELFDVVSGFEVLKDD